MIAQPTQAQAETSYDRTTIWLHWLTAVLVLALFATAEIWDFIQRGTPLRKELQSLHISLGLLFAAVIVLRLGWRVACGKRLPSAATGMQAWLTNASHKLLYVLLLVQIALGFVFRWAQAEPFMFFWLFPLQFATDKNRELAHFVGGLHNKVAWIIIVLSGLHAATALIHHYVLKDGVLKRMWSLQTKR
jgi:cytochrome b561